MDFDENVVGWWNNYKVVGNTSFRLAKKLKMFKNN